MSSAPTTGRIPPEDGSSGSNLSPEYLKHLLEGHLSIGSGRGLEGVFRQSDRIEVAAGEDEVGDISLLSPGLRRRRGDQAQSDGEGRQPAAYGSAAAQPHGLSVSR